MLTVRDRIVTYASDGRKAYEIVDAVFADIINSLRHDPHFRGVSAFDLELLLADARAIAERRLVRELRDRIHVADIIGEDQ